MQHDEGFQFALVAVFLTRNPELRLGITYQSCSFKKILMNKANVGLKCQLIFHFDIGALLSDAIVCLFSLSL